MTDPPAPHVSRVRGHIGAATASATDLLDLLTAGLAEDNRHTTPGQPPPAVPDRDTQDDPAGRGGPRRRKGGLAPRSDQTRDIGRVHRGADIE